MADPLAYFITWTCYGTWLHGDERGSVDLDHNIPGEPLVPTSASRLQREVQLLQAAPVRLNDSARRIVTKTIEDHCRIRRWEVLGLNVRTNHVHVVVTAGDCAPERVMNDFKVWATRRLREAGLFRHEDRIWTRHGSTRYLNDPAAIEAAVNYVRERQGADLD